MKPLDVIIKLFEKYTVQRNMLNDTIRTCEIQIIENSSEPITWFPLQEERGRGRRERERLKKIKRHVLTNSSV
jgi:hypothetical protein